MPPSSATESTAPVDDSVRPEDQLFAAVLSKHAAAEDRPEQAAMVREVAEAVIRQRPLVVQAGTGTGKSLAYLMGASAHASKVVVSTATKQLGEQLMSSDLPLLAEAAESLGVKIDYRLLMGRGSYLCQERVDELLRLDEAAGDMPEELDLGIETVASSRRPSKSDLTALNALLKWASDTETGTRQDAPVAPDAVWSQVSVDGSACPGASACPFGVTCFAEKARAAAREADIVVTNHALLAADMVSPQPLFADAEVVIIDEVHEAESYLSRAWGTEFSVPMVRDRIASASRKLPKSMDMARKNARDALVRVDEVEEALATLETGLYSRLPTDVEEALDNLRLSLIVVAADMDRAAEGEPVKPVAAGRRMESGRLGDVITALAESLSTGSGTVKWVEQVGERIMLKSAPLNVGHLFRMYNGERLVIGTSATAAVGGDFTPIARTLGMATGDEQDYWHGVDVGTPFDHQSQSILYVPDESFPEPVGRDRSAHTKAVLDDLTALVTAAGGRTLALFTTTKAAKDAAEHLRKKLKTKNVKILAHGDAPAAVLAAQFAEDETSVLCATMGFWSGLSVPGPSCSLVVIDKIPFAPMDDPLMSARRSAADEAGRNGFTEVFTVNAALLLAQGTGRLIRTKSDKGVVAILDRRVLTKGYGRTLIKSLPSMRLFSDRSIVEKALFRLTTGAAK